MVFKTRHDARRGNRIIMVRDNGDQWSVVFHRGEPVTVFKWILKGTTRFRRLVWNWDSRRTEHINRIIGMAQNGPDKS